MELIGKKVRHKVFQIGEVTNFDGKYLTVEFPSKIGKFAYPNSFETFLTMEDTELQSVIMQEIEQIKIEQEKKKYLEKKESASSSPNPLKNNNVKKIIKVDKRAPREEGKAMTFFVFQGSTFDAEYHGGYIWAPQYTASGRTCHHWDRLLDVRKGDIIIHGADGYIKAISIAKDSCYEADSPAALKKEELWANEGRRVDCDYIKINKPIKTSEYREIIKQYCGVKYAPFDKYGNGNMGYLFAIDQGLAKFFIEMSTKQNGYLLEIKSIKEFIA